MKVSSVRLALTKNFYYLLQGASLLRSPNYAQCTSKATAGQAKLGSHCLPGAWCAVFNRLAEKQISE